MKTITYNAGNASSAKVRADIEALAALKPVAIGLQEVADRRAELANVPGYRTIQENGSVKGHVALLVREDAKPGDPQLHQIGKRTHVGPDVAGARTNGWTAAKYILAVDVTDTDTGKPATVATMHLVPSASHSQAASALLKTQAANAAAWLAEQPLPTDLMGDCNGRAGRHEFAPLRKVATAVSAPSRKGAAIDIHWLKGCAGKPVALDGYSSDHKPVVAVIALPTAAPTPAPKEPVVSTVEKLASIAEGEVGYHEGRSGGHWNNHEKYAAQVPTLAWVSAGGYPWCAVFVCWVFNKAGVLELIPGGPTASVAHFRDAAKAAGRFSEYPAVGAIALYGTAGDAHTGLVVDFDADTITAIEGNTNDNGSAEGDGVYRKVRQRRDPNVYGYAYPAFPEGIESADPAWVAQAPKVKPKRRRKAAAKPAPQPAPAHRPKHERAAIHETRTVIRNAKSPARKRRFRNALNWLLGRKK